MVFRYCTTHWLSNLCVKLGAHPIFSFTIGEMVRLAKHHLFQAMESSTDTSATTPLTSSDLISDLRIAINDPFLPLSKRYRALFGLKHHACLSPPTPLNLLAISAIASGFSTQSALLKHEVAYCLGQTRNLATAPYLRTVLMDKSEDPMVRHESAEALGALGDQDSLELLRERRDDLKEEEIVRDTCEVAVSRLEWERSDSRKSEKLHQRLYPIASPLRKLNHLSVFNSIDPAPPLPSIDQPNNIPSIQSTLLDTSIPLFYRYRAMFALRDLASPPSLPTAKSAVQALASGFADPSALFRHEIAFVFGQLSHPASIPALVSTLQNMNEVGMVRHEAAEALGSLGNYDGVEETLRAFLQDDDQVVRESVAVALDMAEFERSGKTEYAILSEVKSIDTTGAPMSVGEA